MNLENLIQYVEQNNLNVAFISLDNEKAFDRIEQNYVLKVLDKYNFPSEFTSWTKILYKNISAKLLVNGTFTEKINISRSVRQGCPISMLLYVLSLERLIQSIQNYPQIDGLKIPNYKHEIKVLNYADDIKVMVRNDRSYCELRKETKTFGVISGSKINEDKTEVYVRGKFELIPKKLIKYSIKVYGCYFGEQDNNQNYKIKLQKMETTINKWKYSKMNLCERILLLKCM